MAAIYFFIWAAFVWSCSILLVSSKGDSCPSACQCLGSYVDCSRLGLNQVPKDLPSWVTNLEIQSNGILSLHPDDFKGLIHLKWIDLSNNEIAFINETLLVNLPSLEEFKMTHNKLTEIPVFRQNPLLRVLELMHNKIHTINATALEPLKQLDLLDLSNNDIREITNHSFPANLSLTRLLLRNNEIIYFEAGCFHNLTKLQSLKLNRNKISHIPKMLFFELKSLQVLDLSKNKLSKLMGLTFQGLENLQRLRLQKNEMSTLEDGVFYGLTRLQHLHLDENNLTSITQKWLYGLANLQELSLAYNQISKIGFNVWEFAKQIEILDLSHNSLSSLDRDSLANLGSLQELILESNKIEVIQENAFRDLKNLLHLNLNNNVISSTIEDIKKPFVGLDSLRSLWLESNSIRTLTKQAFTGLQGLEELRLNNNNITQIQGNAFAPLTQLKRLSFNTSTLFCDCQLSWVPLWLHDNNFEPSIIAKCSHPASLGGRSIFAIDSSDFKCDGQFLKPEIVVNPRSEDVLKGENITLNCTAASTEAQGKPTVFKWKKDDNEVAGVHMENFAQRSGNLTHYESRLHVSDAQDSDAGRYRCIISNEYGSAYSERANINVYVFPTFTKRPQNVTIKAGSEARLVCAAEGQPKPVISWQKDLGFDHFPAAQERRMHVIPDDDHFYIMDVKAADEGNYSCIATNEAGTIVANVTLSVLQTPSFVRPMMNKEVRQMDTAVLECLAQGSPRPTLKWYHNGKPLVISKRHFFTAEDQLLLIVETEISDAGVYTCEMSNTLGQIRGTSNLTVVAATIAAGGSVGSSAGGGGGLDDESTTTGIIIIAVVCCVVGTSLVWVIIIYQTRKRQELYSATPTDETTLPGEIPSSGYMSSEKESNYMNGVPVTNMSSYQYHELQMKESGYESSSGRFRAARPAIFPSDVNHEELHEGYGLMTTDGRYVEQSDENSMSSQEYPQSDSDSIKTDENSVHSSQSSQRQVLTTFLPHGVPNNRIQRSKSCSNSHIRCDTPISDNSQRPFDQLDQSINSHTNPDNSAFSKVDSEHVVQSYSPSVNSDSVQAVGVSLSCRHCGEGRTCRDTQMCKHNRNPPLPPKPLRLGHGRHKEFTRFDRAQPPGISRSSSDIQDYMYEDDIPPPPPPLVPYSGVLFASDYDDGIYLTNGGIPSSGAFVPVYHHAVNTPQCDCHLLYSPPHKPHRPAGNKDPVNSVKPAPAPQGGKGSQTQRRPMNGMVSCVHRHVSPAGAPSWQGHAYTLPYMPVQTVQQRRAPGSKVSPRQHVTHNNRHQQKRQQTSPKSEQPSS